MNELLKEICAIQGISGFEYKGNNKLKEIFSRFLNEVYIDSMNNVIGYRRCGVKNAPVVLIEAHFDKIGLMVKTIEDNGFVTFISIGGVDPRTLPCAEVIIHGIQDTYGVIGMKPPHILSKEEMEKGVKIDELTIDTGYDGDKLKDIIMPGDPITIKGNYLSLKNNNVSSPALDNRAGITVALSVINILENDSIDFDICVMGTTTEETGRIGALTGSYNIAPDFAIIIDVTHGATPDATNSRTRELTKGPAICLGPNLHPKLSKLLIKAIKEQDIPYQIEVEAGDTGTNAWMVQVSGAGVPCTLISIPLKYMHTGIETINLLDVTNTANAIVAFLKAMKASKLEGYLCLDA